MMRILITGAGSVMGQSIYKALSKYPFEQGIEIFFANSDAKGAGQYFNSESLPIVDRPIFPLATDPAFISILEEYVTSNKIDFVFSGTQHELLKIAEYNDSFGPAATLSSKIVQLCLDKAALSKALADSGVPLATTWEAQHFLTSEVEPEIAYIVKPSFSSASRNIKYCLNEAEAKNYLTSLSDLSQTVVQETLKGIEYTTGCYVDRYTKQLSTITFERDLSQDGASVYGDIVVKPEFDEYMEKVYLGLKDNGFEYGHFNVQFIDTASGPQLFEINGRLSSTESPKAYFGFNSCAAYIFNKVFELPFPDFNPAKSGKFLRYYDEVYF